jgi:hypothetical protein
LSYKDSTNKPDRVFNQTKLDAFQARMQNATEENLAVLYIEKDAMETSTLYEIQLVVISRWGLESNKTVTINILDFPAPMVQIYGDDVVTANRTGSLSLVAEGIPSKCANVAPKLGFQWTETTGNLNFANYPDIRRFSRMLVIPPFILEPEVFYNFTVACFLVTEPTRASTASVSVQVNRSPVFVVLGSLRATRESRMITRGDILVLDARESQDPDFPTPEGQTFKGTFGYYCRDPNQMPCFEGLQGANLPDVSEKICRVASDVGADPLIDGGKQFSRPLFDDGSFYCRYARGVLMVKTDQFINGKYKWSVEIRAYDGRTAIKTIEIEITDQRVPQVTLMIMGEQQAKYPISQIIKITGTVESTEELQISYDWRVYTYQLNPEYDPDRAKNDDTYNVEQRRFVVNSNLDVLGDKEKFSASADNPLLIINPGTLKATTTLQIPAAAKRWHGYGILRHYARHLWRGSAGWKPTLRSS